MTMDSLSLSFHCSGRGNGLKLADESLLVHMALVQWLLQPEVSVVDLNTLGSEIVL